MPDDAISQEIPNLSGLSMEELLQPILEQSGVDDYDFGERLVLLAERIAGVWPTVMHVSVRDVAALLQEGRESAAFGGPSPGVALEGAIRWFDFHLPYEETTGRLREAISRAVPGEAETIQPLLTRVQSAVMAGYVLANRMHPESRAVELLRPVLDDARELLVCDSRHQQLQLRGLLLDPRYPLASTCQAIRDGLSILQLAVDFFPAEVFDAFHEYVKRCPGEPEVESLALGFKFVHLLEMATVFEGDPANGRTSKQIASMLELVLVGVLAVLRCLKANPEKTPNSNPVKPWVRGFAMLYSGSLPKLFRALARARRSPVWLIPVIRDFELRLRLVPAGIAPDFSKAVGRLLEPEV